MSRQIPYPKRHPCGQSFVKLKGKFYYFGKFGTPESDQKYFAWRTRMLGGRPTGTQSCMLSDLFALYGRAHPTEDRNKRSQLRVLSILDSLAGLRANEYGPLAFQEHRSHLLASGTRSARQVNDLMQFVQRIFRWGVSKQLVPLEVWTMLKTVERLKPHESVKQTKRRTPVPAAVVAQTLPYLSEHCADMVRLIVATGARPGEILSLRAEEIVRSYQARPGWWYAEKTKHKTSNKNKKRFIEFPPETHAILERRWPLDERSPKGVFLGQNAKKPAETSTRQAIDYFFPAARDFGHFRVASLRQHIGHMCRVHGIPKWEPAQLRHLKLTDIAGREGLEAASKTAGHSGLRITENYIHEPPKRAG